MIFAAAFVAVAAVLFALRIVRERRRAPALPAPLPSSPPVVALLPVRDEEANVEACLEALLGQSAPVRVRVLDDGSTDATRELAERAAAADTRVEVLAVPPPPAGRSGKINALAHGAAGVEAAWILAVDADARPAPDAVARALAAAREHGLAAVSLAARQRIGSPGEALLTPLVFALLDALLGDWRRASRGEGAPVANGQFFLVERRALAEAGGYEAIAGEPLDDVALARRLAATGRRVGFWRAGDALSVRMYAGFGASFRGWRRNLALILGHRRNLVAATVASTLAPAGVALAALATGDQAAALVAWLGGALASILARTGTGSPPFYGSLYPVDAATLSCCLLAAARDRTRDRLAPWRGRRLDPGQPTGAA